MSGLLGDIFGASDALKRKISGLLADPIGVMNLGATRLNEDQAKFQNDVSLGFGDSTGRNIAGYQSVLSTPQQQAAARAAAAKIAAEMGMAGATVWHGSPHKFDKFDASKIGTGEGAQAYGHGLYLADAKKVADGYAGKLSKKTVSIDGFTPSPIEQKIFDSLSARANTTQYGAGSSAAWDHLQGIIRHGTPEEKAAAKNIEKASGFLGGKLQVYDSGSLYKVDLPDEHIAKMLDWDKPLSQQPQIIEALRNHPTYGTNSPGWKGAPDGMWEKAISSPSKTGEWLYRDIADNQPKATAEAMQNLGVPGVRYLDGSSRGAGGGTSNYVVFPGNENLLQILERNGKPVKGLLP